MTDSRYYTPQGGLPPQSALMTQRAVFTESYAVIPKGTLRDITTSNFPHWDASRAWVIARPMSGFSETFSHYVMDVAAGGGSTQPEPDKGVEAVLFVTQGTGDITIEGTVFSLQAGSYVFLPAGTAWMFRAGDDGIGFHWIRKRYVAADGVDAPVAFVTSDGEADYVEMPDTDGRWATTRFVASDDLRHDMHVNIVTFQPGGVIPFEETHVMEHGLYVLEGKAVYKLNQDWVEVEAGDYMWLRAFCPQACYAGGPGPFRYLLYKDVNRHMPV
ncbi:MAG: bifunctional allantoicase/(S)-ureidoglycine aminohydrolase [Halocynthiibacter sp.]